MSEGSAWTVRVAYGFGLAVVAGASAVLVLWTFGGYALLALVPGYPAVKANTAIAYLLLGAALVLLVEPGPRWQTRLARALAGGAAVIAGATGLQELFDLELGIDELLVADPTTAFNPHPGRMSPITAAILLLSSLALVSLDARKRRWLSGAAVHATGGLLLVAANGYLYGALSLAGISAGSTGIAIPAMLLSLALGTGILLARPDRGVVRLILREDLSGRVARTLLPLALLLPLAAGVVTWGGAQAGLYGDAFAQALLVAALTLTLVLAVSRTTWLIARAELRREEARRALEASQRELERRVEERTRDLAAANESLRKRSVARELARRVLALGGRDLSASERRQLGRSLATEMGAATVAEALEAFHEMGAGAVTIDEEQPSRWRFHGEGMLEVSPDQVVPTCALALGYLEGTLARLSGHPTLGTEVRCRSQGHERCEFVVAARPPAAAAPRLPAPAADWTPVPRAASQPRRVARP